MWRADNSSSKLRQAGLAFRQPSLLDDGSQQGGLRLRKNSFAASVSAAVLAMSSNAALAGTLADDAKAFGKRQLIHNMDISPSGKKVVLVASGEGAVTVATVIDLATTQMTQVARTDGKPENLYWCGFAGENHLVCQYGGIDKVDGDALLHFSRLIAVSADGSKMRQLGQLESDRSRYLRQSDGQIIDWLPGQEGQVLMARTYIPEVGTTGTIISRTKEGLGVDQIDLEAMKSRPVEQPRTNFSSYITDGRGNVRVASGWERNKNSGQLSGRMKFKYRPTGSSEWQDMGEYDENSRTGRYPLAVDPERNALFARKRINGRDGLVQIALDGTLSEKVIATHGEVDIDGVVRFGGGQRVIGYTFADELRHTVYFDPEFDKLHRALKRAIPDKPMIQFLEASRDGQELLILASGDRSPGTFYKYSRPTRTLGEVSPVRPDLEGRKLAAVQPITFTSADGMKIPGYLTLPPEGNGKNLPAVVLPHGGPSARDEWGFDWLPQFLAARGYAVIQPNYRGSDGYGDAWLVDNGFKSWKISIGDVTAAAKYLVAQGIADPQRLSIVGWSYGGYAALQSAAVEPGLYKSVVAIAPVTDLAMTKKEAEGYTNRDLVQGYIGDGPHVIEGSPLKQASRIKVPVLLVHGDMDANVGIAQSERMLAALKSGGTPAEMLRFNGLDHQLDDSTARIQMLTKIGELLDRTTGK